MDEECKILCEAMNLYPGVNTIESCWGHGKREYHIWFVVDDLKNLPELLYFFDKCHSGRAGWHCEVSTDCGMSPVHFLIEGPAGKQAYEDSLVIADCLKGYLKDKETDCETGL